MSDPRLSLRWGVQNLHAGAPYCAFWTEEQAREQIALIASRSRTTTDSWVVVDLGDGAANTPALVDDLRPLHRRIAELEAEVARWKSALPTIEGHDVAWWREEERRTAGRLQAALNEWNEQGQKNGAKIARLEKEVDDAQKRWAAFRVKASADAHSIVTIANGLKIQG